MMHSTLKISNRDSICRCEEEEGSYEHYKRNEERENYFKTAEPHEMVEWENIQGRKFKGRVAKIISTLRLEVEPSIETVEHPFFVKMQ